MNKKEVLDKLKKCDEDLRNTSSPMRKRDLYKYRKRLQRALKKNRGMEQ